MKNRIVLAAVLALAISTVHVAAQGLNFNPAEFTNYEGYEPTDRGFATEIPASVSLRQYAPTPKSQIGSTCLGWATAYAAMSIHFNYMYDITDRTTKDAFAFDPYFLYQIMKGREDYTCDGGSGFEQAFNALTEVGVKRQLLPYNITCERDMAQDAYNLSTAMASTFKISGAMFIDYTEEDHVEKMKYLLSEGYPLIAAAGTYTKMVKDSYVKNGPTSGLWEYRDEYADSLQPDHAMCIIGYSDTKYGGAWEIQNSWGSDFGDQGYVWVKYADFNKLFFAGCLVVEFAEEFKATGCQFGDCDNKYSRGEMSDGTVYEGQVAGGVPQGYGLKKLANGAVYAGYFAEGVPEGYGIFVTPEAEFYKVQVENGEIISGTQFGFTAKESVGDDAMKATIDFISEDVVFQEGEVETSSKEIQNSATFKLK
jgi:hypothetical protein